jgi:phosphoribosylamine--glycine ligase
VLVLGSGGREHALAWRLVRDSEVTAVISAPGNPGTASIGPIRPVDLGRPDDVLSLAVRERIDLTVVGPEAALQQGVADVFERAGRAIVGPSARAAALECSKVWSKQFMERHDIPTAGFATCKTVDEALAAVGGGRFGFPVVVKADGLAAGKGVTVAETRTEAEAAVREAMEDRRFGSAGARLVIEECLSGPEVSVFALADGEHVTLLGTAQDHKRIADSDRGPNTGGMGAFAPSPLATPAFINDVVKRAVLPVVHGMAAEGHPYRGFLYVSLMLTDAGPKVIEYNVRFGDPEAQVVLPLIEGSLTESLLAAANGRLGRAAAETSTDRLVGVVLASEGYPGSPVTGRPIDGLDRAAEMENSLVFHAGTKVDDGRVVTSGGRVLTVVGRGDTFEAAMKRAYDAVDVIHFEGMQYRRDIGRKALAAGGEVHVED